MKLECKRADTDMNDLRKTLEQEKRKLKVEQQVGQDYYILNYRILYYCCYTMQRHQSIVEECRVLKKELNQLKIAHNRLKKRA